MIRALLAQFLHWPIGCAPHLEFPVLHILWSTEWGV